MRIKLLNLWYSIRSSYWFLPSLLSIGAVLVSFITVNLDQSVITQIFESSGFYPSGPQAARLLLATIAGSMITIAGVVFSITILAMTLASSQFGPRILLNFMRDTGNQIVLGAFVATFLYNVLVLLTVDGRQGSAFVPHLSVIVSVILAISSLGLLIYFIHHAAASIQVTNVITRVSRELGNSLERIYSEVAVPAIGPVVPVPEAPHLAGEPQKVLAASSGYIQAIDLAGIVKVANEKDLIVRIERRAGSFVVQETPIARVWPKERTDQDLVQFLSARFITGNQRTHEHDVEFAIEQLVEIAVRALSPGVNDPFTAVMCVDQLGARLRQIVERPDPGPYMFDQNNEIRVIIKPVEFADLLDTAFNQIRQHSRSEVSVTIRLLEAMEIISQCEISQKNQERLLHHAGIVWEGSQNTIADEADRQDVGDRYQAVVEALISSQHPTSRLKELQK